ncbi:MAG: mucoidy inhibitor MuiA family protein [Phycisphaerales bacterium]|jgi:uncharacterized protein (TIGR02231 family)
MKNQTKTFTLTIAVIALWVSTTFADVPTTTGAISKVTVYRGQALVTRTIDIDLPAGASELIVKDLPARIVSESIYAQTSDNVKVLSVRYREYAVRQDTREEVKQLDAQIEDVEYKIKCADRDLKHFEHYGKMFDELKSFTVTAEHADLNRGLLTYEPIEKLAELIERKALEYHKRITELQDKLAELAKEKELLQRKRNQLQAGYSRTERQAVLFLNNDSGRKASIELSYLVNGANWQQQYNLRANPQKSNVLIEYNAVVNQASGENWDGVALSLSTAQPTMVAAPPILEPMLVGLSRPAQVQQVEQIQWDFDRTRQYQMNRRANFQKGIAATKELNQLAIDNQTFIFNSSRRQLQQYKQQIAELSRTEGLSVTYNLPGKLTLPSRNDQQLITIASINTKADFTLIATPLLTDYVYLQAEILNDSETVFLPGQASIFRNGEFVGKGNMPQVTIGEKFTAGFGIDSQVQVTREIEDKKTRIQGGNQIDTYEYRIALSNYKNKTVELRLLDRLPYTDNTSIKIELGKTEPQLSSDSEYLRTVRKKGILRWDLELKPNTVDRNATIVKYSFTMEYDRNMQIQPRRSNTGQ